MGYHAIPCGTMHWPRPAACQLFTTRTEDGVRWSFGTEHRNRPVKGHDKAKENVCLQILLKHACALALLWCAAVLPRGM